MEHQGQLHGGTNNKVDELGNPAAAGHGAGAGPFQPMKDDHKTDGALRRSGSSSSSSSSEDDGVGGRRKKGMKEKIKEKLPGVHKQASEQQTAGAGGGAYGHGQEAGHAGVTGTGTHGTEATGEKKGMMDKIKEKLPGQH